MSLELLDWNFTGLSPGEFILKLYTIADKMEVHPYFNNTFPDHVTPPVGIREYADVYKKALDAVRPGDKKSTAERNAAREKGQTAVMVMAYHIAMVSIHRNDPTILHDTGYDLKHRAPYGKGASGATPPAIGKFRVTYGDPGTGTLQVTVSKTPNTAGVELQASEENPPTEESFKQVKVLFKCRNMVDGFQSAKRYHLRARYYSSAGVGPWSQVLSIVVT